MVFSPDGVSTAYLYNDIALRFKEQNYDVCVLTTTPHYNVVDSELKKQPLRKKALGLYYESNFQGIKVKHVYQKKYANTTLRIFGFIYWHIVSFILGLFEKDVSVILSPSPPLTIGIINVFLGRLKGAKVIYNVQEIYPDLLIEKNGLKSNFLISLLKKAEKFVYNKSDAVTTIDEVFHKTLISRFKNQKKLHIIPNFVDTDIYKPIPVENLNIDNVLFPKTDSLKLMYAGNIGIAQDWTPLIELADNLREENIEFFVIGEGAMREYLISEKEKRKLSSLHIIPYQPRELMPQLLAYSDLQFIFMAPEVEGHGFPSKIYTIMSCAKPILVSSGANTPIVNFLQNKDCSYIVSEKDINLKIQKMTEIIKSVTHSELVNKGRNGYTYIEKDYSKKSVTKKYVSLVDNLIEK